MDLRVEKGAMPVFELRDNDPWYTSGPMFAVAADGTLQAGGKSLLKIPHGEWFHVELRSTVGERAEGTYQVIVSLPGQPPQHFQARYAKSFKSIGWFLAMEGAGRLLRGELRA